MKRTLQHTKNDSDIHEHLETLYKLVLLVNAKTVIELGVNTGESTVALLEAVHETKGTLISVDRQELPSVRPMLSSYGLVERWKFYLSEDIAFGIEWPTGEQVDLVFVDTTHEYEQTKKEIEVYEPILRPGGVMVFHDTVTHQEGVQKPIDEFLESHPGWKYENKANCNGLGILYKPSWPSLIAKAGSRKVGIISRGSPDYLIDIVTDGALRILGRGSVCLDYNVRGGWGGGYAHLFEGFSSPEPFDIHDAEVLICSSRSIAEAKEWMAKTGREKVAVIDGEDGSHLHEAASEMPLYFKREFSLLDAYPSNVLPLPFAAIPELRPEIGTTENLVFYQGHPNHPFRVEVKGLLKEMGFEAAETRVEKVEYNKRLISSLIGVSVRGCGWDTYRYWEIPYFGAALLAQRPQILIPDNFIDGYEAVFYDSIQDLRAKIIQMVSDQERTFEIAQAGTKASVERHLSVHRAKTVLEALL